MSEYLEKAWYHLSSLLPCPPPHTPYNMDHVAKKPVFGGLRTTKASAQSGQRLCYSLIGKYHI